jgi:hypothetical protein
MASVAQTPDLWHFVQSQHWLDPDDLFESAIHQAHLNNNDYRTRLLIRDSLQALGQHWGEPVLLEHLKHPDATPAIAVLHEEFERPGYPSLKHRLVKPMNPEFFDRVFRKIGDRIRKEITIPIGGSTSLILQGMLRRATEDIDIVDEVPAEIRNDHAFLELLESDSKIIIAHFQRHYLPMRWENRTQWYGVFGSLTVTLVDAHDIFLSKLFSIRSKDMLDMEIILPQLDRTIILNRLKNDCASLLSNETYRDRATNNWYILTGDRLEL